MLRMYCDESGTHAGSPYFVVAGYISADDQWEKFSVEWQGVLDRYGIDCFHMTDFENRQGAFKTMRTADRKIFFEKLLMFARLRTRKAIPGVVLKSNYEELITDQYREDIGSIYTLCANVCLRGVHNWAGENARDEPIAFVFEQGAEHCKEILEAFSKAQKDPQFSVNFKLASLKFENRREVIPLQVADLLAYEVWKNVCNDLLPNPRPVRWPLTRLSNVPIQIWEVTKQSLTDLVLKRYGAQQP